MDKHEELEKWKNVHYRMKQEGIEYCFRHYSDFREIDDQAFHLLRMLLVDSMEKMETLVHNRINELENQISEDE
jgi:hypothetical protein